MGFDILAFVRACSSTSTTASTATTSTRMDSTMSTDIKLSPHSYFQLDFVPGVSKLLSQIRTKFFRHQIVCLEVDIDGSLCKMDESISSLNLQRVQCTFRTTNQTTNSQADGRAIIALAFSYRFFHCTTHS
mmetsp:Transcript_80922/g.226953  ORF Transcript_80922/g.226953 Transcript_80922/m.226953 type:complete len:131 (+) Transcript_80922:1440-1832(+)